MPFIPHTEDDIQEMLSLLKIDSLEEVFSEIPKNLLCGELTKIPRGVSEMELNREMQSIAARDKMNSCFIGAGAYEHHIPAAVWDITSRGEFMTAYTPYQAEASQGTLQLIYEFQTMVTHLLGMDVTNASMYDGATALAEAILMAVRANRKVKTKRVLIPTTLNPSYRKVLQTLVSKQDIEIIELPYCTAAGIIPPSSLTKFAADEFTALVIMQPNFFGALEAVDALSDWAHEHHALVIACVNPTAMALLKEPGAWGLNGADIVCGEGQPLGCPLASGGPYFGFLACRQALVRQMPGRIVGATVDSDGQRGYTLTLQAREQHIRRGKATSNICTNQGLLVTAATVYMSLLGFEGLRRVAVSAHQQTTKLLQLLNNIPGIETVFDHAFFHEIVIRTPIPSSQVIDEMAARGILAGYDLSQDYIELGDCLLICVTETKSDADIKVYAQHLAEVLNSQIVVTASEAVC